MGLGVGIGHHASLDPEDYRHLGIISLAAFLPSAEKSSGLATYNGARWTAVKPFDANNNIWSVNCPSAKFCAAVGSGSLDGGTPFATFNGKTWSARASVSYAHGKGSGDGTVPALSCTSASFCFS